MLTNSDTAAIHSDNGQSVIDALEAIFGASQVLTSDEDRSFFSQDLFQKGALPIAVIRPRSVEALAEAVTHCSKSNTAICVRGGGMSYTDAFLPKTVESIVVDMSELNRVVEINPDDFYAVVEAGCTWADLDKALTKHGLRSKFWGPFSGFRATIGGSMSQGTVNFGSVKHGPSAMAALAFDVILGNGTVLHTGSGNQPDHAPFFRHYGPDLTGLFANDAGALGIKARITLALERRPEAIGSVSYAVASFEDLHDTVHSVTGAELASEVFAVDAAVMDQFMGDSKLVEDAQRLLRVGLAQPNPLRALTTMARIALNGRNFLKGARYTVHFVAEGRDTEDLKGKLSWIRRIVGSRGMEIANTMPTVVRAEPFPPLPVLHADGRRLLPMHGILPHSKVKEFHKRYTDLLDTYQDRLGACKVTVAGSFTAVNNSGFLYEPVFYWEDSLELFHERYTAPDMRKTIKEFPANDDARELVSELKKATIDLMFEYSAVHLQIGKTYPYLKDRPEDFKTLIESLKHATDPNGLMNPGALGLSAAETQ